MAWYVFALLEAPPSRRPGKGLARAITVRTFRGCFVAAERRADVPPIELDALKRHHHVIARLWNAVPAVLPVRFGTLLDETEIAEALEDKEEELAEAFNLVRGRAQFSWRAPVPERRTRSATMVRARELMSGTEYLRRAARASTPPPRFTPIRRRVAPLVAAERYEPSRPAFPETLYHLVDRKNIDAYLAASSRTPWSSLAPTLGGPYPPYAFVPELLI
jgi:hypothetical protein